MPRCSIYAAEDAVHISFDDYEDTWAEVSWDNFYEGIQAQTTEEESMNTISRMKEVIRRYEEWHGFTHDECLSKPLRRMELKSSSQDWMKAKARHATS